MKKRKRLSLMEKWPLESAFLISSTLGTCLMIILFIPEGKKVIAAILSGMMIIFVTILSATEKEK